MVSPVIEARGKVKDVIPAIERLAKEFPAKTIGDFKTCQHCGHSGFDVTTQYYYLGGQGYVPRDYCIDRVACWIRWDNGHN